MDWLQGIFQYIEKAWNFLYCFWDSLGPHLKDIFMGIYSELVDMLLLLIAWIPIPASLQNITLPQTHNIVLWAVGQSGLIEGMVIVAAGASVKVTRWFLKLVV